MPQPISIEPCEFRLRPSRVLRRGNLLLIATLLVLGASALPWLMALIWATLLMLAAWRLDRQLQRNNGVELLRFDAEGWALCDASGSCRLVQWQSSTTVLSLAVVLRWRDGWHWRGLLITPDMLGKANYRRLCRLLWQSPATPALSAL